MRLPSTAAEAGVPAFSVEEAVAVLPWLISGSAACAVLPNGMSATATTMASTESSAERREVPSAGANVERLP